MSDSSDHDPKYIQSLTEAVFEAIEKDDVDSSNHLLTFCFNIRVKHKGFNILHASCFCGSIASVQKCLDLEINIDELDRSYKHNTLLIIAIIKKERP